MPKKKSFIDKKNAETYLVIHRGQKFPGDSYGQQTERQPAKKKDYEEHIKCGIYFDDDYDYMQHLRDLNEVAVLEKVEKTVPRKTAVELPIEPDIHEEKFDYDCEEDEKFDPEVEAALEGNFDFDNPDNELDDDFVLAANEGILPSTTRRKNSLMEHRSRAQSSSEDGESSEIEDSESSFNGGDVGDEVMEDVSNERRDGVQQRMIDEQFEHLCDEYDDGSLSEAEDEQESEMLIDPNSLRIKELVEERKREKDELVLEKDELVKRLAMEEDNEEEEDKLEDITLTCSGPKKAKWDCESILSTYSNLYNHPCLIKEPSNKRKLRNFLKKAEEDYQMEEVGSIMSTATVSSKRPKGETPEERRIRKALVKERRRERIVEKKCNKLAFKEERLRRQAQQQCVNVKTTPIV